MTKLKEINRHRFLILFPRHDNKPVRRGARQDAGKKGELNFKLNQLLSQLEISAARNIYCPVQVLEGKGRRREKMMEQKVEVTSVAFER